MYWYLTPREKWTIEEAFKIYQTIGDFSLEEQKKLRDQVVFWNAAKARYFFEPNDKELKYFLQPHGIKAISGGNRCLGENEEIYDPVQGEYRKISEIDSDFHVLSLNNKGKLVIANADKPFVKGRDRLYEIYLSYGLVFVSTLAHQVLSSQGYISVDLAHKQQLFLFSPLLSTSGSSRIEKVIPVSTKNKPFYDFHVPLHNNYYHKGIIHHNSGKTATNVVEIVMQCEGWHPLQKVNLIKLSEEAIDQWVRDWCKKLLDKEKWIADPPIVGRMVVVDYPNYCDKIVGPEIQKWATLKEINSFDYDNQNKRSISWKNGSWLEFLTHMQPLKSHGGSARHLIYFDEEPPQEIWAENNMRLISLDGRALYGATAVEGISWTEEKIFVPAEQGSEDIYMMEMSTYDNPRNTTKVINRILAQCTDETDVDIRIHGKRRRKGGNVYKMAQDNEPWIIPRFEIPKDKGILVLAIDTHPHIEHAGLWIWVDYEGIFHPLFEEKPNFYEVAEFFEHGTPQTIRYYTDLNEIKLGRKHDICLLEPAAWNTDQQRPEDTPIAMQLEDEGFFPQKGSKDRSANILRVGNLLTLHHEKITDENLVKALINPTATLHEFPDARPRLMTFSDLDRTRYERRNWYFPTYRNVDLAEHGKIKPRPVDKDDHIMEDEGRIVAFMEDFEYGEFMQTYDEPVTRKPKLVDAKGNEIIVDWDEDDEEFDPVLDM